MMCVAHVQVFGSDHHAKFYAGSVAIALDYMHSRRTAHETRARIHITS